MQTDKRPGSVHTFMEYLPKAMKFHSLKNEHLARIIFILVLAANFISQLYIYKKADAGLLLLYPVNQSQLTEAAKNLGILTVFSFFRDIAIYMISAFYLLAFIRELRGEPADFPGLSVQVVRRIIPYIIAFIAVTIIKNLGLLFFIVPGIILYILFLFNTSLIIDGKCGFFRSFKISIKLTEGYKRQIFNIVAFIFVFFSLANMILGSFGSMMVSIAISSFITTVGHLVTLRMIALLYVDLYGRKFGQVKEADINKAEE